MTSDTEVSGNRKGQIQWMNQTFYHEAPFDLDEIVSVTPVDGEAGYCDCCDEMAILTQCIVTFDEDRYRACEDCGQKIQRVISEMSSFK